MGLDQPGLLYVAATLLPLASFVLLLLVGGLRQALRRYPESPTAASLYRTLGGDAPGRAAAYVATGAIGLSFVLCLAASFQFFPEQTQRHHLENEIHEKRHALHDADKLTAEERKTLRDEVKALTAQVEAIDARWTGRLDWVTMPAASPPLAPESRPRPATALQVGFRIDHLSAVMFLMVSLIATLIHLFSIGYMADELNPVVEDHQVHTAGGHLHRRGRFGRFFLFMSLFCFSMLNLVLADNLFQVFVSWELVGICSYLLIGFYYERFSASTAANKAFITNRVGDAGFIIGLMIVWTFLGTFNFEEVFAQVRAPLEDAHHEHVPMAGRLVRADEGTRTLDGKEVATWNISDGGSELVLFPDAAGHLHGDEIKPGGYLEKEEHRSMPYWLLVLAGLGIFLGCVGKSAQFPLQVWLPDAMEGPTPVSALIHAATMVAAGVYLVGRVFPLFAPEALLVIAYTGGITLFLAATVAVVQTDIKKVLAYSTVSQLGYMMLALGVGGWSAGLFHLITHACFKALLFLGSGSVIYGCHHEQEMTKMGGLYPKMKITALTMLVGVLAIAGTPLFSGWYSKDAILSAALGFASVHPEHTLLFLLPLVTAGITTFYMFRMWFLTFTGAPRDEHVYEHAHESPWVMTLPLVVLAFFSIFVAWGAPPWDAEGSFLEHQIHHAQPAAVQADFGNVVPHDEPFPTKDVAVSERAYALQYAPFAGGLALLTVVLGIAFAVALYFLRVLDPAEAKAQFPAVHRFLWHKWYFDELYSVLLVRPALVVANGLKVFDLQVIDGVIHFIARLTVGVSKLDGRFDLGVIDGLVNLTATVIYDVGGWLRNVQTGYLRSYVLFLVLAAVAIFLILSWFFASLASAGG